MRQHQHSSRHSGGLSGGGHYLHLAIMLGLSFVAMYALMYAMVDRFDNVIMNVNQAYMAALMTAPMAIIELVVMRSMYSSTRLNLLIGAGGVVVLMVSWLAIRGQVGIGDTQFLRSMIPHHGGAVLMCEEAPLRDEEIRRLCSEITASQQAEIARMKAMLARLE
jgi:uncharacterized protein (DUF305 family)